MSVWTVVFSVRDEGGQVSTGRLYYPLTLSYTELSQAAQVFASALDECISGRVESIGISTTITPDDVKAAPQVYSDVEEVGIFIFTDQDNEGHKFSMPTILDSVLWNFDLIDITDPRIAALVNLVLIGVEVTDDQGAPLQVQPVNRRGAIALDLQAPYKIFRSSRRR